MRTRAEIESEYAGVARIYGDRVFKGAMLQSEIKALHDKMTQLSQEIQTVLPGTEPEQKAQAPAEEECN